MKSLLTIYGFRDRVIDTKVLSDGFEILDMTGDEDNKLWILQTA